MLLCPGTQVCDSHNNFIIFSTKSIDNSMLFCYIQIEQIELKKRHPLCDQTSGTPLYVIEITGEVYHFFCYFATEKGVFFMCEKFINSFITRLSDEFTADQLMHLRNVLSLHCQNFDVTEKTTDLVATSYLPECLKAYLVTRKIEGVAEGSLKNYSLRLRQMFEYIGLPYDKITTNDIRVFLYRFQSERGISDRTLDGIRSIICTFFGWIAAEGYISVNPASTIKPIKYMAKPRGHLTETEIEMMRDACTNLRDKALLEILYSTGCRVSEVIGMDISDVNMQTGEIQVLGKGKKYRTVYMNVKARIALQKYLQQRKDDSTALFVSMRKPYNRLYKAGIEKVVKDLGHLSNIDREVFPHLIRHSTATHAIKRNMNVVEIQKMLGHSNLQTTMIYAEVADSSVKQSHQRCIV